MRKYFGFLVLLSVMTSVGAQDSFTRQDSLRGSITPERAWWDLTYYDLSVHVMPESRSLFGTNTIHYTVLEPQTRMQIDLQTPLEIESVVQDERPLEFVREGNAYFITLVKPQVRGAHEA